jgi:transcriptional regulator with XRE-family HTH domain
MVTRIGLASAKPIRTYFIEWREWKGWTQQELANRMETTVATVSRVENGARDWGKGYLEAFAYVIECPNPADPISRPPNAPITLDEMLKDASPEQRRQAIAVVETLLRNGANG